MNSSGPCSHCKVLPEKVPAEWLAATGSKPLCVPCFRELFHPKNSSVITIISQQPAPPHLEGIPHTEDGEYLTVDINTQLVKLFTAAVPTASAEIVRLMAKDYPYHMQFVSLVQFAKEMYPFYFLVTIK